MTLTIPLPKPPTTPLRYVPTLTPRDLGIRVYQSERHGEPVTVIACLNDGELVRLAVLPGRVDDHRRPIHHIVRRFLVSVSPSRVDRLVLNSNTADTLTLSARRGYSMTPLITTPAPVAHPVLEALPWEPKRRRGTTKQGTAFTRRTLNDIGAGIVIHADGSAKFKRGAHHPHVLGAGWVIESERLETPMRGRRAVTVSKRHKEHRVMFSELSAVRYAVADMLEVFPKAGTKADRPVRIYLDCLHAVQFLRGTRDWEDMPGMARDVRTWWSHYLQAHPNSRVLWVRGHSGDAANEEADWLARTATR